MSINSNFFIDLSIETKKIPIGDGNIAFALLLSLFLDRIEIKKNPIGDGNFFFLNFQEYKGLNRNKKRTP